MKAPFASSIVAGATTPCREADLRNPDSSRVSTFAERPAFAGMIVDDTVLASDAWSLTLDHSNRVAHNGV
jgi:hypothetical protein